MQLHRTTWAAVFFLSACGGSGTLKRFDQAQPEQVGIDFENAQVVEPKFSAEGVVTATVDPDADVTQIIEAAADSAIANTKVAFPPGALTLSTDITIQAGSESLTEDLAAELPLSAGNSVVSGGTPVQIDASQAQDLSQPFVLAIAVPAAPGLVAGNTDRLAILYQVKKDNGTRLEAGIVPRSELTIENGAILFSSKYFGWFRAVYLASVEIKTLVADSLAKGYIGLKLIQDAASLPACTQTDVGITVYVLSDKTFRTCTTSGWKAIDLKGPKGDAGAKGPASAFVVKDADGDIIGDLISMFGSYSMFIRLANGNDIEVESMGRYAYPLAPTPSSSPSPSAIPYPPSIGGPSGYYMASCVYMSADCAGPCYLAGGGYVNALYFGPTNQHVADFAGSPPNCGQSTYMESAWIPDSKSCLNYDPSFWNWPSCDSSFLSSGKTPTAKAPLTFPLEGPLTIGSR